MQTKKEHVRDAIMNAAGVEFRKHGFQGTSMRKIAGIAGVTLSNIYNYFPDKDALFRAILSPILEDVDRARTILQKMESGEEHLNEAQHLEMLEIPIAYVQRNREMLRMLFFQAEGSSLSGYLDELSRWFGELMRTTADGIRKRHGLNVPAPSPYLLEALGSVWTRFIVFTLRSDLSTEEIREAAGQLMRFLYHGFTGFMGLRDHG